MIIAKSSAMNQTSILWAGMIPFLIEHKIKINSRLFLCLEWEAGLKLLSKNGRAVIAKLAIDNIKRALRDNLMTREFEIIREVCIL
ncbi:MAG: hypothetical protein ACXQTS_05390 [Candidatus Methanospirareceae archaeon]